MEENHYLVRKFGKNEWTPSPRPDQEGEVWIVAFGLRMPLVE